jgi:hypothetical protein
MVGIVDDAAKSAEDGSPARNGKQNGAQDGDTRRQRTPLSDLQNVENGT